MLEGGTRTSTLRALTPCTVARATASQIDRDALARRWPRTIGERKSVGEPTSDLDR